MLRPWQNIPLLFSKAPLTHLPKDFYCLEPHCYQSLGAPYGNKVSPWMLRGEVIRRLLIAQSILQNEYPKFQLAIFDAWRPIRVQKYMYDYAVTQECRSRGLNSKKDVNTAEMREVLNFVEKFWALPSYDKSMPPPHSTGGAVDLTLASSNGELLDMGGEIDCMDKISHPLYYSDAAILDEKSDAFLWNKRRIILMDVMKLAGFAQHPNEWWHFSYGDQLWAWAMNLGEGYFGSVDELESNSII